MQVQLPQSRPTILNLLDRMTSTIRPDNENVLKLYTSLMRTLRYVLGGELAPSEVMGVYFPLLKALYIGTTFAPEIEAC